MKINLNIVITNLLGQPLTEGESKQPANLGKYIAQAIAGAVGSTQQNAALKYWRWAKQLQAGQDLELDKTDSGLLIDFINSTTALPIMYKGQALEIIEAATKDANA